jgi:endonuclease YncB( thermonuclease family)
MNKSLLAAMLAAAAFFCSESLAQTIYDATGPVSPEVAALANIGDGKSDRRAEVRATVIAIADGDTFWAEIEGKRLKIRTPANDAPVRGKLAILQADGRMQLAGTRALAQPHSEAATQFLAQQLPIGSTIVLRVYLRRDLYGRMVADPIVDGRSVSLLSIQMGHAWYWQTYGKYLAPADRKIWNQAMKTAKAEGRGLWSPVYPCAVRPSQWRRNPACPSQSGRLTK